MIDALGFKGIWKRAGVKEDPDVVLRKLQDLRTVTLEEIKAGDWLGVVFSRSARIQEPIVRFLSDTIFAALPLGDAGAFGAIVQKGLALQNLTGRLSRLLRIASIDFPTLAYRGCITFGDFQCQDVFILGEAVDEVASMMNEADGAFVWLSPSAKTAWEEYALAMGGGRSETVSIWKTHEAMLGLVPYAVPLKAGGHFQTYAVSLFDEGVDLNARAQVIENIERSFDSASLRVQVQKQNTLAFLEMASRYLDEHLAIANARGMAGRLASTKPPETP